MLLSGIEYAGPCPCTQAQELDDEEDEDSDGDEEEMVEVELEEGDDAGPIEGAWGTEEYIQDDSALEVGFLINLKHKPKPRRCRAH